MKFNRRVRRIVVVGLIVLSAFSVGACRYLGFINPAWPLEGSWKIVTKPDLEGWEPHTYFVFTPGAERYQFQNADRAVFESGPITSLTESSFDYEIDEFTLNPDFVPGQENYAEYTMADVWTLSITFYADREKSANFGTIIGERE